ncbi:hypothetical protein ACOMHN_048551 [Nucella lapillus]
MQTLYEEEDSDTRSNEDPWSESHAVSRITEDRDELYNVLRSMSDDPRVTSFLMEYDANYQRLVISNNNRLNLRDSVRELRAKSKVSGAKSVVVERIYKSNDEHISKMRCEINVVYHQLIELQEAEDGLKKVRAGLAKDIANLNAKIQERQSGIPASQVKVKEELERRHEDMKAEREKVMAEVEHLREEFTEATNDQSKLEKSRLRVEDKIAETQRDFFRVNNDITKETQKKNKLKSALNAGQDKYENREKDMQDLQKQVSMSKQQCKSITEGIHATTVKTEKLRISVNLMANKIRTKQYDYEELMHTVNQIDSEIALCNQETRKKNEEVEVAKEMVLLVEKQRRLLKNKVQETEAKKEAVIHRKEKQKHKNLKLAEDVMNTKRKMENSIKEHTDLVKQRDCLRKALMKEKNIMHKDHMLLTLHQLANKRLTQDNDCLLAQAKDNRQMIHKLENERDSYIRQAVHVTRKDFISKLKTKSTAMTYETQKLLQERDYRDECLVQEELALQKLNRQIFILKANLRDLKESNARMKMIIENQDMEEKNLIKMTRVMKMEKIRETKGMERVIRDIDGLDLALTRRHHDLHDLYKMVKLKQSLLEKGENMYNVRWKEYINVSSSLKRAKAQRHLDCKNRAIVDQLMNCVKLLKTHLENVRLRSKGLMEELSHPRNIHRWRNILARDPEAYETVRNLHKIRQAIQVKVEHTTTTVSEIQLMDREYISLTTSVLMQPSPETVLQLKLYQEELQTRYKQIKKLTADLREALDNKTDMVACRKTINRKLQKIQAVWLGHKAKESRRLAMRSLESSGPLPFLPGPAGLSEETKAVLKQLNPIKTSSFLAEAASTPNDSPTQI